MNPNRKRNFIRFPTGSWRLSRSSCGDTGHIVPRTALGGDHLDDDMRRIAATSLRNRVSRGGSRRISAWREHPVGESVLPLHDQTPKSANHWRNDSSRISCPTRPYARRHANDIRYT